MPITLNSTIYISPDVQILLKSRRDSVENQTQCPCWRTSKIWGGEWYCSTLDCYSWTKTTNYMDSYIQSCHQDRSREVDIKLELLRHVMQSITGGNAETQIIEIMNVFSEMCFFCFYRWIERTYLLERDVGEGYGRCLLLFSVTFFFLLFLWSGSSEWVSVFFTFFLYFILHDTSLIREF